MLQQKTDKDSSHTECGQQCSTNPAHSDFLHSVWRKTYATLQHRAGVDARTIQKRLGHNDLSLTLAYLEGEEARSDRSRDQVNATFGAFA
jgi:integrase/recombinase XerD